MPIQPRADRTVRDQWVPGWKPGARRLRERLRERLSGDLPEVKRVDQGCGSECESGDWDQTFLSGDSGLLSNFVFLLAPGFLSLPCSSSPWPSHQLSQLEFIGCTHHFP